MADNTTPKPPKKRIKTTTPILESCAMCTTDQDSFKLKDITEASKLTGYLSPLGRKLIKKSLESQEPLNLKAINQTVLDNEDSGFFHCKGRPKIGDDKDNEDGVEDIDNKESTNNNSFVLENTVKDKNGDNKSTKFNNNSEEYAVKDPFIKSDNTKAKDICLSCGVIPCKT